MKEKHRVPRTNNSGFDLGLGSRKASRKPLVGNIYVFVPRALLCLAHRSFLAHVVKQLRNAFCHLSITLFITCSFLSVTSTPIFTASLKSYFTQTSVSLVAESFLVVLHSSHVSGVGTLWISLRRKLFPQDEQRIHLPPTLTLTSTLLQHAWRAG